MNPLQRTAGVLHKGIAAGEHTGAQVCVVLDGRVVADLAVGNAAPGIPMRIDSILPWLSAGKPITALAVAAVCGIGTDALDRPVADRMPDFGAGGKDRITIRHLLEHTGGFRPADLVPELLDWRATLDAVAATPIEEGWEPGSTAGYHRNASWFVLGELLRRNTGETLEAILQATVLAPLGLGSTRLATSTSAQSRLGDRIVPHHDSVGGVCRPNPVLNDPSFIALERPGSGFRGPANELARLYSGLLTGNLGNIPPAAIRLFTGRRREGRFDRTFQARVDCGYGFIVNSGGAGPRPAPYGYGPHASAETFGHSGAQTGCGFADPAHGLAVAWLCNGMPGEPAHQRRQREINSAIYEDLGLAAGR